MLTDEMQKLIRNHTAGMVATIGPNGTPKVSPKATFVVLDEGRIAYGDLRSPGTRRNIAADPSVEVCFIDVVLRKAVRVSGHASFVSKIEASAELTTAFETLWAPYIAHMSGFVEISIEAAEMILSPGYDIGLTEAELKETNLKRLNGLYG